MLVAAGADVKMSEGKKAIIATREHRVDRETHASKNNNDSPSSFGKLRTGSNFSRQGRGMGGRGRGIWARSFNFTMTRVSGIMLNVMAAIWNSF